jgi:hypothetical protein
MNQRAGSRAGLADDEQIWIKKIHSLNSSESVAKLKLKKSVGGSVDGEIRTEDCASVALN